MTLAERLGDESSLTRVQLESLQSYASVIRRELRLREAAAQRTGGVVSIGSYYRTVQQARINLRKSMATVVVGILLGLIKIEDVRRLFELLGKVGTALPEDDEERFAEVVEALMQKLVM